MLYFYYLFLSFNIRSTCTIFATSHDRSTTLSDSDGRQTVKFVLYATAESGHVAPMSRCFIVLFVQSSKADARYRTMCVVIEYTSASRPIVRPYTVNY